jgi:hypothetical protein
MKCSYGFHTEEARVYIFPNKAEREAWLQESEMHEHLGSNTFVADMRLHAIHHGTAEASAAFVSLYSPLQFGEAISE